MERTWVSGLLLGTALAALSFATNVPNVPAATVDQAQLEQLLNPGYMAARVCRGKANRAKKFQPTIRLASAVPWFATNDSKAPPLFENLGDLTIPVTTTRETAQRYFDQGLRWTYGFNHAEALRAFRHARRIDPGCAMCYWGEALVLGANINAPMDDGASEHAVAAISKAQELADTATPREQALITALAKRYSADPQADRAALDKAYADAMGEVAERYPDDHDIQVFYAESLMNLSPWDYWEADGRTSKGRTAEVVATLERVLAANPDHPAAIHLYIHIVEASTTPERAEPYADRLGDKMPGSGHLVHMPSHIYYRVGRYVDSLDANVKAVAADEAYLAQVEARGIYPSGYYPHNIHFVVTSAQMAGDGDTAIEYAEKLVGTVEPEVARSVYWTQPIMAAPYFAHAQFSTPDTILAVADPGDDFPFVKAMWHYARAIARTGQRDFVAAYAEGEAIARIEKTVDFSDMIAGGVPAVNILRLAQQVIAGRMAQAKGDLADAEEAFRDAVATQDSLPYMEPPYWYYPVRRSLGAVLVAAGNPDEAVQVFRRSLLDSPNDGWALYGLMKAQEARKDTSAARVVEKLMKKAWAGDTDILELPRL